MDASRDDLSSPSRRKYSIMLFCRSFSSISSCCVNKLLIQVTIEKISISVLEISNVKIDLLFCCFQMGSNKGSDFLCAQYSVLCDNDVIDYCLPQLHGLSRLSGP